ncbi:calcium/sodium antiporter [Flexibacterium corallicola]|uniref:calcium/sodium antiporter n=1 Tax=Flexibacterium corallicola TaxID=3037259 RepID=UPI00286EC212|nr:calcium/sodium antiporter [Pseudovibrio sp. M1P-2-3]
MLFAYISLIGGLAALVFAGDLLVRGSVGAATKLGIPSLVIGLTIVAFGTSAPELVISLKSALEGAGGIAIGNVVGSNIANVLLVLGLPALIAATPCSEKGATRNAVFAVVISLVFIALCFYGPLSYLSGILLLALLALFLGYSAYHAMQHRKAEKAQKNACSSDNPMDEIDPDSVPDDLWKILVYVVIGLIGLPVGAHFTIEGAVEIARSWGVTDAAIGLTVVALGTSLPELATTLMAAIRKQSGVALGNVIGSNIFNILAILGITTIIIPVPVPEQLLSFDLWVMLACAVLLMYFAMRKVCLGKVGGALMTLGYIAYIYMVLMLGSA